MLVAVPSAVSGSFRSDYWSLNATCYVGAVHRTLTALCSTSRCRSKLHLNTSITTTTLMETCTLAGVQLVSRGSVHFCIQKGRKRQRETLIRQCPADALINLTWQKIPEPVLPHHPHPPCGGAKNHTPPLCSAVTVWLLPAV